MTMHRRTFLCAMAAAGAAASTSKSAALFAGERPPAAGAFTAAGNEYHFDTGVLRGTLRAQGQSKGLGPVEHIPTGKALAGAFGLLSPYRLLTPEARFGTACWDWTSRARLLKNGAVEVRWTADQDHPLNLVCVYRIAAADTVDVRIVIEPQRDLRRFELFLASYFQGFSRSFTYVRDDSTPADGGKAKFIEATQAAGSWQMFPRDDQAIAMIRDGRWKHPPNPVDWIVRPRLAVPLAIRRDPVRDLAAVLMAGVKDCFAISMPYGGDPHGSVYLSLFGRDLKAGQSATAEARLIIASGLSDDRAVALYRTDW